MKLSIGEAAELCGVSIRALRYYDEIGLVKPDEISEAGYRFYRDKAMADLQQVVFLREIEIPLKTIAVMLRSPDHDRKRALENHRELLLLKRKHIDDMLRLVDETIGGITMKKPATTWEDIENAKTKYADEVRERWGDTEQYRQSQSRKADKASELEAAKQADDIFAAFAASVDEDPAGEKAMQLVKRWQKHITDNYYDCSKQILAGLGEMYVQDERFTANIDRFGDGTARFMSEAIKEYCRRED